MYISHSHTFRYLLNKSNFSRLPSGRIFDILIRTARSNVSVLENVRDFIRHIYERRG